ncbi:hypothetical protein ACLOJK_032168 [Asimina triloba]
MPTMEEKKEEGERAAPATVQPISFGKLLSYAEGLDWVLMGMGTFGSVVHGLAQPMGYLFLGKALNGYGNHVGDKIATINAIRQVVPYVWYMAIATLPAGMLVTTDLAIGVHVGMLAAPSVSSGMGLCSCSTALI